MKPKFQTGKMVKSILVILAAGLLLPSFLFAKNYDLYVDQSAGSGGDGSKNRPFDSIGEAIEAAEDKGGSREIYIKNGKYKEKLEIPKSIKLSGQDRAKTIISGSLEMRDGSSIASLTVAGGGTSVTIAKDADAQIDNCTIRDFGNIGIEAVAGGGKLTVRNSKISGGSGKGFYIQRGKEIEIRDNEVSGNAEEGIDIRSRVSGEIKDNEVEDNGESGIELVVGSADLVIEDNALKHNGSSGIAAQFYKEASKRGSVFVGGNEIRGNKKYGIDCNMPQGGKPGGSYWNDSIELTGNEINSNKIGAISGICDLIDAVDEDEEADNIIVEGGDSADDEEESQTGDENRAVLTQEEKEQIEKEKESARMEREEKLNEVELLLEEQSKISLSIDEEISKLKKENIVKRFLFDPSRDRISELISSAKENERRLDLAGNILDQVRAEADEEVALQEVIEKEKDKALQQRAFLEKRSGSFSVWDWVKKKVLAYFG